MDIHDRKRFAEPGTNREGETYTRVLQNRRLNENDNF